MANLVTFVPSVQAGFTTACRHVIDGACTLPEAIRLSQGIAVPGGNRGDMSTRASGETQEVTAIV